MNRISLQTKIIVLALILIVLPIISANIIFLSHRVVFSNRGLITAISSNGDKTFQASEKLEERRDLARTVKKIEKMTLEEFQRYLEKNEDSEEPNEKEEDEAEENEEDEENEEKATAKTSKPSKINKQTATENVSANKYTPEKLLELKEKKLASVKESIA